MSTRSPQVNDRMGLMQQVAAFQESITRKADYDALAKDADSAKSVPGVANGNWHYQCFLHWKNILDHQMPTPATYQGVGEIYSLEDGTCTDDMNRGVLKVILHEVCAAKE